MPADTQAKAPALSVAMSVYDGERFLAPAIESVLAQTFEDFEFLILDDGSRDSSLAIARHYAAIDSRIRIISRENRGLVTSLNQLLAESRAPLVARMDADDICLPERFARQVAFLDANPDHGVVGSWSEDIDEFGRPFATGGRDHPVENAEFARAILEDRNLLCHPAVTYRRDVVLSVGGYHRAYRHVEDHDLWLRLASVTKMANLPMRLIRYRHYAGQVSSRHATEQQIGHSVALMAWRERQAGRPDPTAHIDALPPLGQLDALFGRDGVDREVRARLARALAFSRTSLAGDGFDHIMTHVQEGGDRVGLWRTAARLVTFGMPGRAARLAAALVHAG
ncbi:glycosyltransferase [Aurantiacibacter luteus]|uniref:Glycosyl transferase family 2 n=1 Tax=Aurantiacibacter luteus TaxID=1581420 RepID=A0A0G9MVI1_9SPHN|nr:glycosyltransferase [Aurantiacibacter luteus]KLE34710.1 glycosyl transferase family 2 [Aurantiacibacter luteus]